MKMRGVPTARVLLLLSVRVTDARPGGAGGQLCIEGCPELQQGTSSPVPGAHLLLFSGVGGSRCPLQTPSLF